MPEDTKIHKLYKELYQKHGDPVELWPQWCADKKDKHLREIIIIGAILTQRTSWHNAHLALENLKKESLLSLKKIADLKNLTELRSLIKPAGFYQTKPKRIFWTASFFVEKGIDKLMGGKVEVIRKDLLSIKGIGPETADVILLYALDKPSFVIDEYTKRWANQEGVSESQDDDQLKELFETSLPQEVDIYQNFHALIIIEQRGRDYSRMEIV